MFQTFLQKFFFPSKEIELALILIYFLFIVISCSSNLFSVLCSILLVLCAVGTVFALIRSPFRQSTRRGKEGVALTKFESNGETITENAEEEDEKAVTKTQPGIDISTLFQDKVVKICCFHRLCRLNFRQT